MNLEEDVFVPVGQLNDLRIKAILQIENLRMSKWKRKPLNDLNFPNPVENIIGEKDETVEIILHDIKNFRGHFIYSSFSQFPCIPSKGSKERLQAEQTVFIS